MILIKQINTNKSDITIEIPSDEDINFLKEIIQVII